MEGGIDGWNGFKSVGSPDTGLFLFPEGAPTDELISISISLEEGSKKFYQSISESLVNDKEKWIFRELAKAEVRHKKMLKGLFTGDPAELNNMEQYIEGGMKLSEVLNWVKDKGIREILEYSLFLETNSYDLYLKMRNKTEGTGSEKVFFVIAREEKKHIDRLTEMFEHLD